MLRWRTPGQHTAHRRIETSRLDYTGCSLSTGERVGIHVTVDIKDPML
jgi:hypothetical protein